MTHPPQDPPQDPPQGMQPGHVSHPPQIGQGPQEQIWVLVADDSAVLRALLRMVLASAGYGVLEAADGVEALCLLCASERSMVVLLDYVMPHMDGFAFLRAAAHDGQLLVEHEYLLITSHDVTSLPPDFADLLARLAIHTLPKPFTQDALLAEVEQAAARLTARAAAAARAMGA